MIQRFLGALGATIRTMSYTTSSVPIVPWLHHLSSAVRAADPPAPTTQPCCRAGSQAGRGLAVAAAAGSPTEDEQQLVRQTEQPSSWQQVLSLLQQAAQPNSSGSSDATVAQPHQSVPSSAQQLLPLLSAAKQHQHQQQQAQLLPLLTSAAIAALPQLPPQQLIDVLTALHDLQHSSSSSSPNEPHPGHTLMQEPGHGQAVAGKQQQRQQAAALSKAVRAYLQQHQQAMDAGSTAAVAAALAACQQPSSFPILSMLALENMAHVTPGQLVQLLQAFARVQHYNQAVCHAAAQRAVEAVKQQGFKLQLMSAGESAAAGGASASTSIEKLTQQADSQQQQEQERRGHFAVEQVLSLVQALACLRHHDAALLEAACTSLLRCSQRSLAHMVPLAHSCAVLNHYHLQLFDGAVDLARQAMQQQQQQQGVGVAEADALPRLLAELSWACGVLNHWGTGYVRELFVWSSQVDAKQLSLEELQMWHEVQTSLTDAALLAPQQSPDGLSSSLVVAAQAAWARRQHSRRLTAFQKEVAEALQQAGVRCKLNVALDGPVVVDVALAQRQVGARYRVALQLHPHEDFAANPPHSALGPTAARWRALQARGWRVVTLRQSEWRRLKTKQQQVEYAYQLSQGVEVSAPGMSGLVHQVVVDKDRGRKSSLPQTLLRILLEGH